jgi:hypothetical protein
MCVRCICVLLLFGQADVADEILISRLNTLARSLSDCNCNGVKGSIQAKRQNTPSSLYRSRQLSDAFSAQIPTRILLELFMVALNVTTEEKRDRLHRRPADYT